MRLVARNQETGSRKLHRRGRRLLFEQMERRLTLDARARIVPDAWGLSVLEIDGTDQRDVISIEQVNADVRVSIRDANGRELLGRARAFDPDDIDLIVVEAYGGNDEVTNLTSIPDRIYGYGGRDILRGGGGGSTLYGGEGNDTLYGNNGDDTLRGGGGHDTIYGRDGRDTLYGNDGNDVLIGGARPDVLWGGADNDQLFADDALPIPFWPISPFLSVWIPVELPQDGSFEWGGFGEVVSDEVLNMLHAYDVLHGEAGDDWLYGGAFNNGLLGGEGNDHLWGLGGDDLLGGEAGADNLSGDAGNDILDGGDDGDDDSLTGGSGADIFNVRERDNLWAQLAELFEVKDFNERDGDFIRMI